MLRGRRAAGAVVLVVAILLCVGVGVVLWRLRTWDGLPPDIVDPRACPGSTVELAKAASHFGLVLPIPATEIKFTSDVHPLFGEYFILLSFRTDPAGLRHFLARSGLPHPKPVRHDDSLPLVTGADEDCGLTVGDSGHLASAEDDKAGYTRILVVDLADPSQPRVVVEGADW